MLATKPEMLAVRRANYAFTPRLIRSGLLGGSRTCAPADCKILSARTGGTARALSRHTRAAERVTSLS